MTLTEQIYAHARVLVRDARDENLHLLEILCRSAEVSLKAKLRDDVSAEDCRLDFVAAASLYAVAAMAEAGISGDVEQFSVGDLTVRRKGQDAASCCLRYQAELLMMPYLKDRVAFVGV